MFQFVDIPREIVLHVPAAERVARIPILHALIFQQAGKQRYAARMYRTARFTHPRRQHQRIEPFQGKAVRFRVGQGDARRVGNRYMAVVQHRLFKGDFKLPILFQVEGSPVFENDFYHSLPLFLWFSYLSYASLMPFFPRTDT